MPYTLPDNLSSPATTSSPERSKKARKPHGIYRIIGKCLDGLDAVFGFFTSEQEVVVVDHSPKNNLRLIHGQAMPGDGP